ncbi:hypothetical protein LCM17_03560 [Cereibacter sphaeroides]|nr:hypothetical protein [Cereibacter sphaeroides]
MSLLLLASAALFLLPIGSGCLELVQRQRAIRARRAEALEYFATATPAAILP